MNKRNVFLSKTALTILGIGLLLYAASRTLDFVQSTMPADKQYLGYLFLLATGIGALIWLAVFLNVAEGAKQRGLSFAMGLIDLLGEGVLVYADTMRESSNNGLLQFNQSEMRMFIIASIGMIALNAFAWYMFKLWDPKAERESAARDLVDEVTAAALKHLNTPESKAAMIAQLAPTLQDAILSEVTEMVYGLANQKVNVIDARAYQATAGALPTPAEQAQPIGIPFPIAQKGSQPESEPAAPKSSTRNPYTLPCGHSEGVIMNSDVSGYLCRVCKKPVSIDELKGLQESRPAPKPIPAQQPKPGTEPTYHNIGMAKQEPADDPDNPIPGWPCPSCGHHNAEGVLVCAKCELTRADAVRMVMKKSQPAPQTFEHITLPELLRWWRETQGIDAEWAAHKMMDLPGNDFQNSDAVYKAWQGKNIIPANCSRENWRELHKGIWAMFPANPTNGESRA